MTIRLLLADDQTLLLFSLTRLLPRQARTRAANGRRRAERVLLARFACALNRTLALHHRRRLKLKIR